MRVQRTRSSPSALREPLTRHPLGGPVLALLITLSMLAASRVMAEDPIVDAERLSYDGPNVKTTIYASGFANQRVLDTLQDIDRSRLFRLKKRQIQSIKAVVANAQFCALPANIKKPESELVSTEHFDYLIVKVQFDTFRCSVGVSVDTLEDLSDQSVVERFRRVWAAITAVVPEPPE